MPKEFQISPEKPGKRMHSKALFDNDNDDNDSDDGDDDDDDTFAETTDGGGKGSNAKQETMATTAHMGKQTIATVRDVDKVAPVAKPGGKMRREAQVVGDSGEEEQEADESMDDDENSEEDGDDDDGDNDEESDEEEVDDDNNDDGDDNDGEGEEGKKEEGEGKELSISQACKTGMVSKAAEHFLQRRAQNINLQDLVYEKSCTTGAVEVSKAQRYPTKHA